MLGNFKLHDVLHLYSEQYWPSLADNWCSVNTAKSVEFCLPIVQGGGSSKSGKSLKGVSKESIFASPESIQGKVSCGFFEDCYSSLRSFWNFYSKTRRNNKVKFYDIILFRIATFKKANSKKTTYSVAETGASNSLRGRKTRRALSFTNVS